MSNKSITGNQKPKPDKKRQGLIASGAIKEESGSLVFQKDRLFSCPSLATTVMARHASEWIDWVGSNDRPLDDLRQEDNEKRSRPSERQSIITETSLRHQGIFIE